MHNEIGIILKESNEHGTHEECKRQDSAAMWI